MLAQSGVHVGVHLPISLLGEAVQIHVEVGHQVRFRCFEMGILQTQSRGIKCHIAREMLQIKSALLPKSNLSHVHVQLRCLVLQRVDAYGYAAQCQMVIVKSLRVCFPFVVIIQLSVRPVQFFQSVNALAQVERTLAGHRFPQVSPYLKRVARHVNGDVRATDVQLVHPDFPSCLALCRIFWNTVGQCHLQLGIFQVCLIHAHGRSLQVDAMAHQVQLTDGTLHLSRGNEVDGIEF